MADNNTKSRGQPASPGPESPERRSPREKSPPPEPPRPYRVAVVGGGCAGVAAAWEIAGRSGFEVELFERSWRLGGKGASGRLPDGRIREHGLHLWLGFYENAFGLMRECYREVEAHEWGPKANSKAALMHGRIDEAFIPEPHVGVGTHLGDHGFAIWGGYFAPANGLPGEPLDAASNPYTPASYLIRCVDLVKTLIQSTVGDDPRWRRDVTRAADPTIDAAVERVAAIVHSGALTVASALSMGLGYLEQWLAMAQGKLRQPAKIVRLLRALATLTQRQMADVAAMDPVTRAKTEVIDVVLAIAAGLYRDRLLFRRNGFDAINDFDYRAWLKSNGASEAAIHSRFITGIYEFAFAFEGGDQSDEKNAKLAAGVALRSALRMFFTYRGAMFWRLRSGMGDVVFAPLYRCLLAGKSDSQGRRVRSPVKVNFMHELTAVDIVRAEDEQLYVSRIAFETTGDSAQISSLGAPALDRAGCWPDSAEWLLQGSSVKNSRTLEIGDGFDAVVFAMGIDDLRAVFQSSGNAVDIFSTLPKRWKAMADATKTVATKSAQSWFDSDFAGLGWGQNPGVVTALGMTFETVADMTHTLASERDWRRKEGIANATQEKARSVAYFCSTLPDPIALAPEPDIEKRVEGELRAFLEGEAQLLWPAAFQMGEDAGKHTLSAVVKINAKGSDRYTLSLPGTIAKRLSPLDASVANMTIAGDWTACGLDAGCVEAAVISGRLACHAITGAPSLDSIVGYDHP